MNLIKNLNLHLTITLPLTCAALWLSACSGESEAAQTEEPSNADGGDIDITPDAGGSPSIPDAGPIKEGCQRSKLPSEDACVLHETLGVFVSASKGADTNEGSRARPFASIAKGIATARLDGRRVYVCAEEYAGTSLELLDGVSIFANLTCTAAEWGVSPTPSVFNASTAVGARAVGIRAETRLEGLAIVAASGTVPGESSIGLIADDAPGLLLVDSRITAGAGADGVSGTAAIQLAGGFAGENGSPGGTCTRLIGGAIDEYRCPNAWSARGGSGVCTGGGLEVATNPGGLGGASAPHRLTNAGYVRTQTPDCPVGLVCFAANSRGLAATATPQTAVGANATYVRINSDPNPTSRTPAQAGQSGASGADGANAAPLGTLTIAGYVPASGTGGQNGAPGQGGGGGSGSPPSFGAIQPDYGHGAGGGGGGSGGCPGLAGGVGMGGGASIGILVAGPLKLLRSEVLAATGGLGGRGTVGSAPTAGGTPGSGGLDRAAAGGAGGGAGWSGHGASGPSFGIAWTGTDPVLSPDSKITVAPPREGQAVLEVGGKIVPAMPAGASSRLHGF